MPIPALIPIALMIGGFLANQQAQKEVNDERDQKLRDERLRQQRLGQEADARLRDTISKQERPAIERDQQVAQASREQKYAAAGPADTGYVANPSAPTEVKSEMAARLGDALRRGRAQSQALAKLGARGDQQLGSGITLGRSAQDLNSIGGQSRASSSILPFELQDANAKGQDWRTIADLFNAGSFATGMYGMGTAPVDYGGFYSRSAANPTFAH